MCSFSSLLFYISLKCLNVLRCLSILNVVLVVIDIFTVHKFIIKCKLFGLFLLLRLITYSNLWTVTFVWEWFLAQIVWINLVIILFDFWESSLILYHKCRRFNRNVWVLFDNWTTDADFAICTHWQVFYIIAWWRILVVQSVEE